MAAMDPQEALGIEPPLELVQSEVDEKALALRVKRHVVVLRLEPLDRIHRHRDDAASVPDEQPGDLTALAQRVGRSFERRWTLASLELPYPRDRLFEALAAEGLEQVVHGL